MSETTLANFSPKRTFAELCGVFAGDAADPRVGTLSAELAARTAAATHEYRRYDPDGTPPGLCVAVVPSRNLGRYAGVAKVLDDYGVELRFKRLESDHAWALVWACAAPPPIPVQFVGARVRAVRLEAAA